jgi:hypothetical protein
MDEVSDTRWYSVLYSATPMNGGERDADHRLLHLPGGVIA